MKKRCIGILAHVDAGKTTLSESILYESGVIRSLGRVDHKDAFLDTDEQERARGITIFSKQARFIWREREITLLDTPGHVDFSGEMERVLGVRMPRCSSSVRQTACRAIRGRSGSCLSIITFRYFYL